VRRGALLASVFALATQLYADTQVLSDSTSAFSPRVPHRSRLEEATAIPGRIVYLPIQITGYGARRLATAMWEQRLLDRMKAYLTFADGRVGVRPMASTLRGGGARVFYNDLVGGADAEVTSSLGASTKKRQHHLLTLAISSGAVVSARYASEPNESFHGIGQATDDADRTVFQQRDFHLQVSQAQQTRGRIKFSWEADYHSRDVGPGETDLYPSTIVRHATELPGLDNRAHFVEAGVQVKGVFVDVPGSPTRGNRTRLKLAYSQSVDEDDFSHIKAGFLTEQFLELFHRRTLALELGSDWRYAPFGNEVPFYDLASLGGTEALSGFKRGRFRDRGLTYAIGRYKFPVWRLIEGTVFYEAGRTFHTLGDVTLADWERSYGGGLRVWVPEGVVFEFAVAHSVELTRMLFNFNTTF
jgi:hypothetical protein